MKIISIIPARGGSKGILRKNIISLGKKPLLHYTITASLHSKYINRTIVSSDDKKILDYAKKSGTEVIIRPKKLSNDKVALEPVIQHVLDFLSNHENYKPDVIMLLQNTSPLRTSNHIDNAIRLFQKHNFDSVLSGYLSHKFMWKKVNLHVKPLNYDPKNRPNRQDFKNYFIENGAIYITKFDSFKNSKCRLSGKIGLYEMPEELSIEIDTKYDLWIAEKLLKYQKHDKNLNNL